MFDVHVNNNTNPSMNNHSHLMCNHYCMRRKKTPWYSHSAAHNFAQCCSAVLLELHIHRRLKHKSSIIVTKPTGIHWYPCSDSIIVWTYQDRAFHLGPGSIHLHRRTGMTPLCRRRFVHSHDLPSHTPDHLERIVRTTFMYM